MKRNAPNNPLSPLMDDEQAQGRPQKRPIEAIIFDLDGTIIDTEPTAVLAVEECFAEWDIPIQKEDATYLTGRTWENAFAFLFSKYTLPVPLPEAKQKLLGRYRQKIEENLTTVPGSIEAIQSLAMGILNKAPGSCLIFEDSTAGIASARAAGSWVVAVTSTNHFKQDLTLAHLKITDLTPVNVNWINELLL